MGKKNTTVHTQMLKVNRPINDCFHPELIPYFSKDHFMQDIICGIAAPPDWENLELNLKTNEKYINIV